MINVDGSAPPTSAVIDVLAEVPSPTNPNGRVGAVGCTVNFARDATSSPHVTLSPYTAVTGPDGHASTTVAHAGAAGQAQVLITVGPVTAPASVTVVSPDGGSSLCGDLVGATLNFFAYDGTLPNDGGLTLYLPSGSLKNLTLEAQYKNGAAAQGCPVNFAIAPSGLVIPDQTAVVSASSQVVTRLQAGSRTGSATLTATLGQPDAGFVFTEDVVVQ